MSEYFVAESYKNFKRIGTPYTNEKGKLVTKAEDTCDRCGGRGYFAIGSRNGQLVLSPYDGGVCYSCLGSGKMVKEIRLYTEKEKSSLDRAAARRRERAEEAAAQRKAEFERSLPSRREAWLEKNGFSKDGFTYLVCGNTYDIKDVLKEQGAKFNYEIKWHAPSPLDIPEKYKQVRVAFDDIYTWNYAVAETKEGYEKIVEELTIDTTNPSTFLGQEKERLRNLLVTFSAQRESDYGFIYTFLTADKDVCVWMTQKELEIEVGQTVDFTGTVKQHKIFNGVKQTIFSRCIIKEV